jgi:hypothetical protein
MIFIIYTMLIALFILAPEVQRAEKNVQQGPSIR